MHWVFLAYVVIITNAVSLLLFALRLTHLIQFPVSRSVRLVSAALSMLLAVGLTVFGAVHAANIQIRRYHVRLGQEQAGMETIRLVLLSDIHLGYVIEEKHLAKIVSAVNALKPDIICIAGDIFGRRYHFIGESWKTDGIVRENGIRIRRVRMSWQS